MILKLDYVFRIDLLQYFEYNQELKFNFVQIVEFIETEFTNMEERVITISMPHLLI
jgi:hypothetical protein